MFRYSETEQREILLFDYGLNVGDKFIDENGRPMEVVAVSDTVFVQPFEEESPSHRCLTLRATDGSQDEDRWIEGLGSLSQGVSGNALLSSGNRRKLMYCETGEKCAYFTVNEKDFKAVGYEKAETENEEETVCYDLLPDGTLCITGGWNLVCCGTPYLICRTDGNSIRLTDETLGPLCDCIHVHEVDIRIPGFSAGNYYIWVTGQFLRNRNCWVFPHKRRMKPSSSQAAHFIR